LRIPDRMLSCVGFISHDDPRPKYLGTTFIVGIAGKFGNAYLHAVTAKHVAECVEGGPFLIGVNFKDGKAGWFSSAMKWWYHPTEPNTDVAVTIFTPTARFDMEYVPEASFATDKVIEHYGTGVGDEINVVGLFTRFHGLTKHTPIVRTGNIAMMPSDKIPANNGEIEAYLAEGRSIGGLSGSPVFVRHTVRIGGMATEHGEPQHISGLGPLHFLGLMHGHWDLPVGVQIEQAEAVNMGISIVIPAKKILEVLYHPELIALREKQDEALLKENLPTPGSNHPKPPKSSSNLRRRSVRFAAICRGVTLCESARCGAPTTGQAAPLNTYHLTFPLFYASVVRVMKMITQSAIATALIPFVLGEAVRWEQHPYLPPGHVELRIPVEAAHLTRDLTYTATASAIMVFKVQP
jgi:hypothetical protein